MDWEAITTRLDTGYSQAPGSGGPDRHTSWLATINADGTPHLTGVGTVWADGVFWFETGDHTRKARNIARDPRCTVSISVREFDLVVDGEAEKVIDSATVARMARLWAAEGWPCRVDDAGVALTADYSAQSAGPPPWYVYRMTPRRVTAIETVEPGRATRWTL
jgi:Pyridoxamine 5'-phosphate oxidase